LAETQKYHFSLLPEKDKETLSLINKYQGAPQWLPYEVLFKTLGVKKSEAVIAIPFLERDPDYNIPGVKLRVRCNFAYASKNAEAAKHIQDLLPEVPLVIADMVAGIPPGTESVDFLVFNYGIIYENLNLEHGFHKPRENSSYLNDVNRVVKPGGVVLYINYDLSQNSQPKIENPAHYLEMEMIDFNIPELIFNSIKNKMIDLNRDKKLTGLREIKKFEDFFVPWTMRRKGMKVGVNLLRKASARKPDSE